MKHQALFSSKDKSQKKVSSAAILLGALTVNVVCVVDGIYGLGL